MKRCRCDDCREANRLESAERRRRLGGTEPPQHGTTVGYTLYGCRCADCGRANSEAGRKYRAGLRLAAQQYARRERRAEKESA